MTDTQFFVLMLAIFASGTINTVLICAWGQRIEEKIEGRADE